MGNADSIMTYAAVLTRIARQLVVSSHHASRLPLTMILNGGRKVDMTNNCLSGYTDRGSEKRFVHWIEELLISRDQIAPSLAIGENLLARQRTHVPSKLERQLVRVDQRSKHALVYNHIMPLANWKNLPRRDQGDISALPACVKPGYDRSCALC